MIQELSLSEDAPRVGAGYRWLRINVFAVISLAIMVAGGLITITQRVASYEARLAGVEASARDQDLRITSLENDRHDRDERRIKLATDLGHLSSRIDVLESQAQTIGRFVQDQLLAQYRGAHR